MSIEDVFCLFIDIITYCRSHICINSVYIADVFVVLLYVLPPFVLIVSDALVIFSNVSLLYVYFEFHFNIPYNFLIYVSYGSH